MFCHVFLYLYQITRGLEGYVNQIYVTLSELAAMRG